MARFSGDSEESDNSNALLSDCHSIDPMSTYNFNNNPDSSLSNIASSEPDYDSVVVLMDNFEISNAEDNHKFNGSVAPNPESMVRNPSQNCPKVLRLLPPTESLFLEIVAFADNKFDNGVNRTPID